MNKWLLICFLGLLSVALTTSSLKTDKDTLIKALKEKFRQFKLKSASNKPQIMTKESSEKDEKPTLPKHTQDQHQHDKAASALGLALFDPPKLKPTHTKSEHTTNHEKAKAVVVEKTDNEDDDTSENDDDEDDDEDNMMVTKKTRHHETTHKKTKDSKDQHLNMDSKKSHKKKEKNDDDDDDDHDSTDDDEDTETNDDDEPSSKDSSDVSDDEEDKGDIKNSDKKLKNSVKSLKNNVKSLKDKDLKSVNVGDLKKLLATSVENLDKAERAIHNLLQYDQDKKNSNKNQQTTAGPQQGYQSQSQMYGNYPQTPSSVYQTTCPGQCSSLCAPACRDPCCRFPPSMQGYNSAPVVAKGSYQQGLINAYPPLTSLGAAQSGENYQQGVSQQCGSQCSPQSCAPSCNPSCCSSGVQGLSGMPQGPVIPQGQINAGCPSSCFNTCDAGCPRRCCVPGKK